MPFIASLIFNIFYVVWTFGIGTLLLPTMLLPPNRMNWVYDVWAKPLFWALRIICNITYEVRGTEYIPDTPCIIASKHQSAWETIALGFLLPLPVYILKKELLNIPIFGLYLRKFGMIAINRSKGTQSLRQLDQNTKRVIDNGRCVVLFPEGTRTAPGSSGDYHRGIARLYRLLEKPVVPVALNSGVFWGRNAFHKKAGTIIIEFLPPIASGLDNKTFMATLENTIESKSRELFEEAKKKYST